MQSHRQPITDANYEAFMAACIANPKPHVSTVGKTRRVMSVEIMGDWLVARPGCTMEDIRSEFTETEVGRFLVSARDYAIRRSGDMH